jgi:hypothetical protein
MYLLRVPKIRLEIQDQIYSAAANALTGEKP